MTAVDQSASFGFLVSCVLTKRPHGGTLVRLEALYEADAVLLSCSFHGASIERFVMEVNIFEVLEVRLCVLDSKVALLISFLGSHGDFAVDSIFRVSGSSSKSAKTNKGVANRCVFRTALITYSSIRNHWCVIAPLLQETC